MENHKMTITTNNLISKISGYKIQKSIVFLYLAINNLNKKQLP